jgi:hypothetical protein
MKPDQVIYLGPRLHHYGIGYGNVFYGGMHPQMRAAIDKCPAVGELLVPVADAGRVQLELNFDYAHNMRGESGGFVTFYREIQNWLRGQHTEQIQTPNIEVQTHA